MVEVVVEKPWLRHYPAEVPASCDYPRCNLAEFLTQAANEYPDNQAIDFMGKTFAYREFHGLALRFASALKSLNVEKGDRVAIMLPNCPQIVVSFFGTLMIGAIAVMTNPLYTEREIQHQLKDSGAKVILTMDAFLPRVLAVMEQTDLKQVIVTSITGVDPNIEEKPYIRLFQKLMALSAPISEIAAVDPEEDIALLQYTGGTTGIAKGCMLTHANIIANMVQTAKWTYRCERGQERFLTVVPVFHVLGLTTAMLLSVYYAGSVILLPRFDVKEILETIARTKPTMFPGTPTMFVAIINHPDTPNYDLKSIKVCVSGSAPLPLEVQQKFEEITGGRLNEGYGLSEASPVTHSNNHWEKRKPGIGIPYPDTDARIVRPGSGEILPPGEIGELVVKGPQVMKGYWNRPEETAKVLKDGWLHTGDMAVMDEDGFFTIVGRRKEIIIASGYNIYPREVEEVLYEHPAIREAAVIGVPDPYRGETVKAVIVLKDGRSVVDKELDAFCRARLAAYKVPRIYEYRDSLPKTAAGKILRRVLIEEHGAGN